MPWHIQQPSGNGCCRTAIARLTPTTSSQAPNASCACPLAAAHPHPTHPSPFKKPQVQGLPGGLPAHTLLRLPCRLAGILHQALQVCGAVQACRADAGMWGSAGKGCRLLQAPARAAPRGEKQCARLAPSCCVTAAARKTATFQTDCNSSGFSSCVRTLQAVRAAYLADGVCVPQPRRPRVHHLSLHGKLLQC